MIAAQVAVPSLVPRITRENDVTVIEYGWAPPTALRAEALRAILSACSKFDARSCLAGTGGIRIRLDDDSRSAEIRERVLDIVANADSWELLNNPQRYPKQLLVCRGNGGGRVWDYEQHLR